MRVITTAIYLILTCCGMVVQAQGGGSSPPAAEQIPDSLFNKAVACIKGHDYDK